MKRGGMDFQVGTPVVVPSPPDELPSRRLYLTVSERPEVHVGQHVTPGQLLIDPHRVVRAGRSSPVAGTVARVTPLQTDTTPPRQAYQVVIDPASDHAPTALEIAPPAERHLGPWLEALRRLGPWEDPNRDVGLILQLGAARDRPVDTVLCLGQDAFPPYPVESSLLTSFADEVVAGIELIGDLLEAKHRVLLANRASGAAQTMKRACRRARVRVAVTKPRYPSHDPTVAIWHHVPGRRRLPAGSNPVDQRVVSVHPWTALRLGRWLATGKFDLVRPVFLGWPEAGVAMDVAYAWPGQAIPPLHDRLAFALLQGNPQGAALRGQGPWPGHEALLAGHPLTGRPVPVPETAEADPPVLPDDRLLLTLLERRVQEPPVPCITCGWCAEVCPTRLEPAHLFTRAMRHGTTDPGPPGPPGGDSQGDDPLNWCIECGLCSHVCPSALPLAQTFQMLRQAT